jgi:hypothetical protein
VCTPDRLHAGLGETKVFDLVHARIHLAILEAELGGNDDLIADRSQRFTHPFFVGERTIGLRARMLPGSAK